MITERLIAPIVRPGPPDHVIRAIVRDVVRRYPYGHKALERAVAEAAIAGWWSRELTHSDAQPVAALQAVPVEGAQNG